MVENNRACFWKNTKILKVREYPQSLQNLEFPSHSSWYMKVVYNDQSISEH
jgi:hypothetical protein